MAKAKKYFTGKPCARGHIDKRYVSNNFCVTCSKEYSDKYCKKNKAKIAKIRRAWKLKNKKKHSELNKKSRMRHLEKSRAAMRKYAKENKHVNVAAKARRRARLNNVSEYVPTKFLLELKKKQKNKCAGCRKKLPKSSHLDHIMPIALGGGNEKKNLQYLCPPCNHSKHAKHPKIWRKEIRWPKK